jgi:hypothetical protein
MDLECLLLGKHRKIENETQHVNVFKVIGLIILLQLNSQSLSRTTISTFLLLNVLIFKKYIIDILGLC